MRLCSKPNCQEPAKKFKLDTKVGQQNFKEIKLEENFHNLFVQNVEINPSEAITESNSHGHLRPAKIYNLNTKVGQQNLKEIKLDENSHNLFVQNVEINPSEAITESNSNLNTKVGQQNLKEIKLDENSHYLFVQNVEINPSEAITESNSHEHLRPAKKYNLNTKVGQQNLKEIKLDENSLNLFVQNVEINPSEAITESNSHEHVLPAKKYNLNTKVGQQNLKEIKLDENSHNLFVQNVEINPSGAITESNSHEHVLPAKKYNLNTKFGQQNLKEIKLDENSHNLFVQNVEIYPSEAITESNSHEHVLPAKKYNLDTKVGQQNLKEIKLDENSHYLFVQNVEINPSGAITESNSHEHVLPAKKYNLNTKIGQQNLKEIRPKLDKNLPTFFVQRIDMDLSEAGIIGLPKNYKTL